jgi:hypothetical protein
MMTGRLLCTIAALVFESAGLMYISSVPLTVLVTAICGVRFLFNISELAFLLSSMVVVLSVFLIKYPVSIHP